MFTRGYVCETEVCLFIRPNTSHAIGIHCGSLYQYVVWEYENASYKKDPMH